MNSGDTWKERGKKMQGINKINIQAALTALNFLSSKITVGMDTTIKKTQISSFVRDQAEKAATCLSPPYV